MLAHREVDFAVTETARGGILLKGIGLVSNDVSVVTNVTADHLGLQGIDTVDQLAEVKGVVPRITKKTGWAVLNADDPRVFAMRLDHAGPPVGVLPRLRLARRCARCSTATDGPPRSSTAGSPSSRAAAPTRWSRSSTYPMTLSGLSRFNVENALAAASAALAAGIDREARRRRAARRSAPTPSTTPAG